MLYCHLPDEGILAMHMFRLQLIHYQPSPQKKKTCSIQPQSLFQLVASNFSTKLCRFAGFFHSWCSQSGHWSFPVGFLSHKRLKRACLAPSVSGNACSVWHKGPYFATIPTAFTEKKGIEVITCRSARPEAEQHPEQKKLSKKEWMAVQVLISLLGVQLGFSIISWKTSATGWCPHMFTLDFQQSKLGMGLPQIFLQLCLNRNSEKNVGIRWW